MGKSHIKYIPLSEYTIHLIYGRSKFKEHFQIDNKICSNLVKGIILLSIITTGVFRK